MFNDTSRARRGRLVASASTGALALVALFGAPAALAQNEQPGAGPLASPNAQQPQDDVVVVSGFRGSLEAGIGAKKNANQVVDVITAEEFGKFPDQNVAESIQRITGISMDRAEGEGDKITIRGLEPDLTRVEINGRSTLVIGNVESPNMASSLSIFGSDQFARIEVVKSPLASDDEGGVGGIVRLITAKPLEIGEFAARLSLQGRYNEYSGETDPIYSGTISNVFLDGQLGVLLAASHDDRTRRNDQTRNMNGWQAAPTSQTGRPDMVPLRGKVYSTHFDQQFRVGTLPRTNVDMTVQYQPSETFELYVNANVAHEDRYDNISRVAINTARNRPFLSGTFDADSNTVDSVLVSLGQFTFQNRGLNRETDSYGLTINPEWTVGDWNLSLRTDYSMGMQLGFDRRIRSRQNRDVGYDLRDDYRSPVFVVPGLDVSNLSSFVVDQNLNEYGKARSSEFAYQADVTRELQGFFTNVQFGMKARDNRVSASQGPAAGPTTFTFADAVSPFPIDEFYKGEGGSNFLRIWPYVDAQSFVDRFGPTEQDAKNAADPALTYGVRQDVLAAYAQTAFASMYDWGDMRGNVGVRVVKDDFTGAGWEVLAGQLPRQVETTNSSTQTLPSFNVAFEPTFLDGLVMRFAAGRVMTRPRFTELNPTSTVSEDALTLTRGNPDLNPFLANQFDAGLEYYFGAGGEGLISLAFFHKDIENFVEPVSYFDEYTFPATTAPEQVLVTTYTNGGEGKVSGLEFSVQTPFTFLPAPFDGFGGILNYTKLESSRTLATGADVEIPGNSPYTANATLYYEKGGFSARIAYNYRDTYLKEQFGPGNNQIYVEGQGRIDLSGGYKFDNGVSFTVNVANLTEEGRYEYSGQIDRVMLNQLEGRVVTAGLNYTF